MKTVIDINWIITRTFIKEDFRQSRLPAFQTEAGTPFYEHSSCLEQVVQKLSKKQREIPTKISKSTERNFRHEVVCEHQTSIRSYDFNNVETFGDLMQDNEIVKLFIHYNFWKLCRCSNIGRLTFNGDLAV